jgi:hypothetical protein
MGQAEQAAFLSSVVSDLTHRLEVGDARYGSSVNGFQGEPLAHGTEEALDQMVYLHWAGRAMESLKAENVQLRTALAAGVVRNTLPPLEVHLYDPRAGDLIRRLVEALGERMPEPFTGNPPVHQLLAHWEYELKMGNGYAPGVLAAYAVLAEAQAYLAAVRVDAGGPQGRPRESLQDGCPSAEAPGQGAEHGEGAETAG